MKNYFLLKIFLFFAPTVLIGQRIKINVDFEYSEVKKDGDTINSEISYLNLYSEVKNDEKLCFQMPYGIYENMKYSMKIRNKLKNWKNKFNISQQVDMLAKEKMYTILLEQRNCDTLAVLPFVIGFFEDVDWGELDKSYVEYNFTGNYNKTRIYWWFRCLSLVFLDLNDFKIYIIVRKCNSSRKSKPIILESDWVNFKLPIGPYKVR